MANWQQEVVMAEDKERSQRKNLNQPFAMLVQSISSDSEQAKFTYSGANDKQLTIIHPFNSNKAWIRAIPENGTQYLGIFRSDEAKPQPVVTLTRSSMDKIDQYKKGKYVYRPMYPGEIELNSSGLGQLFLTRRAATELRGGVINRWLNQDKLLSGDRAPIHQKQLMQYRSNELGEEERLGIIARPKKLDNGQYSTWEIAYPQVEGDYTAEHYLSMKNPSNKNPAILFRSQRGHVLDKEGRQVKQSRTQLPLRVYEEYFAKDESSTRTEIDEKGNWYVELADAATEGFELNVPNGNFVKNIFGNETILIDKNTEYSIGKTANFQIGDHWKIRVNKDYYLTSETGNMSFIMNSTANASQMVMTTKGHYFILDDTVDKESIYLIHSKGSQFVIDKKGAVKFGTHDGSMIFVDPDNQSVTIASSLGAVITLKDTVSIADSTGSEMISLNDKSINIAAKTSVNLSCPSVNLASGSINLGNLASFSVTLAEQLAILFDTHIHASPTGPTSPPLPPNTAALMNANPATSFASSFVKVRSNIV